MTSPGSGLGPSLDTPDEDEQEHSQAFKRELQEIGSSTLPTEGNGQDSELQGV